ncbi:protein kinase [Actinoallomurus sp. NBC_01490]|uniref:serine/threonine-protein kinase n=1 Tax=Actinoallomurus sp. NBC_01490 TaxID=2903557 RepID=UPI002E33477E|nr:protein kinase [Actinoallomurus sp. NBC_01490]
MAEAVVGRFTLVDPIGRGATGQVWRAYDHRARRYCAAKVFRQRDAGGLIRVVREQGVRLHHPHVVCPYAWAADDGDVVIAMELMRGGSLQTLIRDHGALPPPYAARIAGQLLSALRHVHEAELLHRDVKPGNVLLEATGTGEPQARLADFGIALQVYEAPVTDTGVILGTPGYLPPEAYEGAPPDPARDVYALGVVVRQMLTGEDSPERSAALPAAEPPSGVPPMLWDVVRAMCHPDPAHRPASARAAAELLTTVSLPLEVPAYNADGEPIEVFDQLGPLPANFGPEGPVGPSAAAPPSPGADLPRRRARGLRGRRGFLALGALVAMLTVAGAAGAYSLRDRGTPATTAGLKVMTWATCADGGPSADPAQANAICVNGRQTDKVAYGIRWHMRAVAGLHVVFLQELCSADLEALERLDGMSGWRFRFAPILDQGSGATPNAKAGPRLCHPQNGASRGYFGIAVGVHENTSFDVRYYPDADVPHTRDRWGHWNVHQVAVCATVPTYRAGVCGTQLTPLLGKDPAAPDAFWKAQTAQVTDLIKDAGGQGRVVLGGDLNSIAPDANGGAGDRSPLVPLYRRYKECDQSAQGGARTGRGTYQHENGTRGAKLDYLFVPRDASVSCGVTSQHVKTSDQVPVIATVAFPAS